MNAADGSGAPTLPRPLSALGLWLLMINGMVGAGIFGVPGELARLTGPLSPAVFLLCAVLIAPVILTFAELGSRFRDTGGPQLYVGTAFGRQLGFQTGWALYVARLTAFAANANLLVASVGYLWPAAGSPATRAALLVILIALMAWINVVGVRRAIGSLAALTLLKLLPLLIVAIAGLVRFGLPSLPVATLSQDGPGLGPAVVLGIYAFVGFESGLIPGGEARDPQRDMPRALLWSLAVCAVLYALVQWSSLGALPDLAGSARPLVEVGAALFGPAGGLLMLAGVVVSVGGNLLGAMLSSPRITFGLAGQRLLPRWFAAVHARHQTPSVSIMVFAALSMVLAVSGSFALLASLSVLTRLLIYLACVAALPRLRAASIGSGEAIVLPGGIAIPALAVVVCAGLLTQVSLASVMATAILLAVGTVLYLLPSDKKTSSSA